MGKKQDPAFKIVVAENSDPIKWKFLEKIWSFVSCRKEQTLNLNIDRASYWIDNGACPSDTVARLLVKQWLKKAEKFIKVRIMKPKKEVVKEIPKVEVKEEIKEKTKEEVDVDVKAEDVVSDVVKEEVKEEIKESAKIETKVEEVKEEAKGEVKEVVENWKNEEWPNSTEEPSDEKPISPELK